MIEFLISLILRNKYVKRLREIQRVNPKYTKRQVLKSLLAEEKSLKTKIVILNIVIISILLIGVLIVVVVTILAISVQNFMNTIAGNVIINLLTKENEIIENIDKEGWKWEKVVNTGTESKEQVETKGGLYPKNKRLRIRAQLLEILKTSAQNANKVKGTDYPPSYVLGTIIRESGTNLFTKMDKLASGDLFSDIVHEHPVCGIPSCNLAHNGVSHFVGHKFSGGRDSGDPRKGELNTDMNLYETLGRKNHAYGVMQIEMPYVYAFMARKYGETAITNKSKNYKGTVLDTKLDIRRPNVFYLPDQIYNGTFRLFQDYVTSSISPSNFKEILSSSEFKSLSKENQQFIKFMYASAAYGRGHVRADADDEIARKLIRLGKDIELNNLVELLGKGKQMWDSELHKPTSSHVAFVNAFNAKYGSYGFNYSHTTAGMYGVYSAAIGAYAYKEMENAINAAPKENIGGSEKVVGSEKTVEGLGTTIPKNTGKYGGNYPAPKAGEKSIFNLPFANPRVSSEFGGRGGGFHYGIDLVGDGANIHSIADGKVVRSYLSGTYGNCVIIGHEINGLYYESLYAHLTSRSVETGQKVAAGQKIGVEGNTGYSFGRHLHFEVHEGAWNYSKSNAVNPRKYFKF